MILFSLKIIIIIRNVKNLVKQVNFNKWIIKMGSWLIQFGIQMEKRHVHLLEKEILKNIVLWIRGIS